MIPGPPFTPPGTSESSGTYVYDQVTGASPTGEPSARFGVATRCTTSPVRMTSSFIPISIDVTGLFGIVYDFDARMPSASAVIVTTPARFASTLPQRSTVAIVGFELRHVAVMSLRI